MEDEYPLQGLVEEALREGGFETAILSSGEEALTLFRGRVAPYRALVTDVNLKGSLSGWDVARQIREMEAAFPGHLHDGCARGPMDVARRSRQHPAAKAVCAGAAGHRGLAASQRRRADGRIVRPAAYVGTFSRRRL